MISRIIKVIFLFGLVGFSTITFQNDTLQSSMNNLTSDSSLTINNNIDMEIFTALIFLLFILGYAIFILVSIVNRTHSNLIEGLYKSGKSRLNYS